MGWFTKKPQYPVESRWAVLSGTQGDQPLLIRKNISAAPLRRGSEFRSRVGLAFMLKSPGPNGLPTPAESERLNAFEDALVKLVEADQRAILVLVVTTAGMREHMLYCAPSFPLAHAVENLRTTFPEYELTHYVEPDAKWAGYDQFA